MNLTTFMTSSCMIAMAVSAIAHARAPAAVPTTATSQTPHSQGDHRTFTLTPAALPVPALKYRFAVDYADRSDGNAAVSYLEAALMLPNDTVLEPLFAAYDDNANEADFAKAIEANANWLDTKVPVFLEEATRRSTCDWLVAGREHGSETLLPTLNPMRMLTNYLSAMARLATLRGDLAQAIHIIRVGIILGDRIDDGEAFSVNNLVSVGIENAMLDSIQRVIEHPASPNLYWALREIPMPVGNYAAAVKNDAGMLYVEAPALKRARNDNLSAAEWADALAQFRAKRLRIDPTNGGQDDERAARLEDAGMITQSDRAILDAARQHYVATRHVAADAAAKLDATEVVSVLYFDSWREINDEMAAAASLPYSQSLPRAEETAKRLAQLKTDQPSNPFLYWMSDTKRPIQANAKADQAFAAFAAVEAVRAYAATHGNALPPSLDAIVDVPVPTNPVTGRPFRYELAGDVATLSDDAAFISYPIHYEIRLRK